jgi:hypothetical protein
MIEKAPGFEIAALISDPGSLLNHLQLQFFMLLMSFMPFLFRLLEKPALHRTHTGHGADRATNG